MPHTLELDRPRDGVVVVRLNRPERLNAINEVMQTELGQALGDLAPRASTCCAMSGWVSAAGRRAALFISQRSAA